MASATRPLVFNGDASGVRPQSPRPWKQAADSAAAAWPGSWPWLALAVPGLVQVALLVWAIAGRYGYPYDLEWMEGGMLMHADRLATGAGIYAAPSVDFIPYLYTPLYPAVIAALGQVFSITYQLARAISIGAVLAIALVMVRELVAAAPGEAAGTGAVDGPGGDRADASGGRAAAWCGVALAAGLFAATYPWLEGWYDIARADTLFVAMVIGGLSALRTAVRRPGWRGHARVAVAGAVLALAFFCKQTGVLYVAVGGAAVVVWRWRCAPVYVAVTGAIGLGGTWVANRITDGWFWTYAYEVHQAHAFSMTRFYQAFGHILGKFPAMTAVIGAGVVAVAAVAVTRRRLAPGGGALVLWAAVFATSCVVGALGWGTQWAHFNAYMPAMTTGAVAAGAAIPALLGAARAWTGDDPGARWRRWSPAPAAVAAAALGVQLLAAWWWPAALIPTDGDRRAGDALIARVRAIDGDVWLPYHPWYARLAGKDRVYTHRMGVMDVSYGRKWTVAGLREAVREARFSAIILDGAQPGWELRWMTRDYRLDDYVPRDQSPRTYTGARTRPKSVWVPIRGVVPDGARALFDFEDGRLAGWDIAGAAWGRRPVSRPPSGQGGVRGYRGRYFLSSFHGGDRATGTLTSPAFAIDGAHLSFRLSGGVDRDRLRVELRVVGAAGVDDQAPAEPARVATNAEATERMHRVVWDVSALAGQTARIVLIDDDTRGWGHLNADDFLLWDRAPDPEP